MFKNNLILLMSMTLILSLNACGEGTTTVKVTNEDGSTSTVVLESLRTQIQNATPLVDYAENTPIDQMETITFGLDEDGKPIEWIVLEKDNKKALLFKKYMEGFKSYYHEVELLKSYAKAWFGNS